MAEHEGGTNRSWLNEPVDPGPPKQAPVLPPLTTPEQLLRLSLPQQRLGGYSRDSVDEVLGRAAQTVERLLNEVRSSRAEIGRLESSQADLKHQLELAQRRTPEEIIGEVLTTAHRAADSLLEKARQEAASAVTEARRESLPVLAEAQRTLEEAGRLHHDAQATVDQARVHAEALLESARAEREQLIANITADAERRRAELEVDNLRLETAIKGLRTEWAGRAAAALARLEGIAFEGGVEPQEEPHEIGGGDVYDEPDTATAKPESFFAEAVVRDLHARLPESDPAGPSAPDRLG